MKHTLLLQENGSDQRCVTRFYLMSTNPPASESLPSLWPLWWPGLAPACDHCLQLGTMLSLSPAQGCLGSPALTVLPPFSSPSSLPPLQDPSHQSANMHNACHLKNIPLWPLFLFYSYPIFLLSIRVKPFERDICSCNLQLLLSPSPLNPLQADLRSNSSTDIAEGHQWLIVLQI